MQWMFRHWNDSKKLWYRGIKNFYFNIDFNKNKDNKIFFVSQPWWSTFPQEMLTSDRSISNSNPEIKQKNNMAHKLLIHSIPCNFWDVNLYF